MNWEQVLTEPLANLPLAFVDVETTGLRADLGDRICEVAVVVFLGARELIRFSSLVNPLRPISPGAAAVNGLTSEQLRHAPTFARIAPQVGAALALGIPVAHNAPFDLSFLAREMAQADVPPPADGALDTLALARRLLPNRRCGLRELAATFDIRVPGQAHRALADVLTTRELLLRLLAGPAIPANPSLANMLELQNGLAAWPGSLAGPSTPLPPELAEVIRPGQRLSIVYVDGAGQRTRRLVEPGEVYARGDALYMVAFCHLRQEQRTFRVDRIVAWEQPEPGRWL